MKVGILSPRSKVYPAISHDFMDGLKTYFKTHNLIDAVEFISESVGLGGSEKEVFEKAAQLLNLEKVDVLLAYIDEKVLDLLQPLVYSANKLMIVINPGANYPTNWVPQHNIIHLTLQQSFCCWLTGALAANGSDKNAATASTFYDCGYLHAAAMVKSFAKKDGNITFNYINNQLYNDAFNINELVDFLSRQNDTKKLLCQFDSLPASLFYKFIDTYKDAESLKLFVSPMMLEENAISKENEKGFNFFTWGYSSWHYSIGNPANIEFINSIKEITKSEANIFSLLGWEAAIILEQLLLHCKEKYEDGEGLVKYLKQKKLKSPRGELHLDEATQFYLSVPYKCSLKPHSGIIELEKKDDFEEEWKLFTGESTTGPVTGWTNTYLCY